MDGTEASEAFLRDVAAKHFVCLSYHAKTPGDETQDAKKYFASCFIAEIDEHWLLVTAGHVITGIREAIARGATYSDFNLHDKLAGNAFPFSVPIPFDLDDWAVVDGDPEGADFAAAPISNLIAQNLLAGGIHPIGEHAWGVAPFEQYPHWLLAGIRDESYEFIGERHTLKLTIIPLIPSTPPKLAANTPNEIKVYAQIRSQPELDAVYVRDIGGMSGGPVFGLREANGTMNYWLIGIQSSWFPDSRIVAFCSIQRFFVAIKEAIRMARTGQTTLEDIPGEPF